ncbi:MAG TPA: hypothetical protein VF668_19585 [Pyrinomonadaceae bacterium]|jgi:hypothetical protein
MRANLTKGLTRLLLVAALFAAMTGVAFAATSSRGRAECPMSRLHACCKKARQKRDSARVAPAARLCCVVNCPQPAPAGAAYTVRPSHGEASDPRPPASAAPAAPRFERARAYAPPFQPSHSPPAYIQHAAFLI